MQTPPLYLGAALLFWGWHAGLLPFAAMMAIVLEVSRKISSRWNFSDKDFNHLADLTAGLFVVVSVYLFIEKSVHGLFTLLTWMPFLFLLLPLFQVYSTRGSIKLSALFFSLRKIGQRRYGARAHELGSRRIDVSYSYTIVCVVSAACGPKGPSFYWGLCVLAAWGLWIARPKRYPVALWAILLICAIGLGYVGQFGLVRAQMQIEQWLEGWLMNRLWGDRDPYRQRTAIGDIGTLKLSNRILFRVKSPGPILLRQASYDSYFKGTWGARYAKFTPVTPPVQDNTWLLAQSRKAADTQTLGVSAYLDEGKAILALPGGAFRIKLPAGPELTHNPYGAVKLTQGPGLLDYEVDYGMDTALDSPPAERDNSLPSAEKDLVVALAAQLGGRTPQQTIQRVETFFANNFKYSLILEERDFASTPLGDFLNKSRAGHCEFFAAATVLLLRATGIPARYAVGYGVQEYSFLEEVYVVRRRHAHAWALAYVDGRWQDVDTTPPDWGEQEKQAADWWEPAYDYSAWLGYLISKWRWRVEEEEDSSTWFIWLLIPLVIILLWRLSGRKKTMKGKNTSFGEKQIPVPGMDSAFFHIVRHVETSHPRGKGEPLTNWLARIKAAPRIRDMLALHNRYRFDPAGITEAEKTALVRRVGDYFNDHAQASVKNIKPG
ncbi:MAG: transglutaminase domain-containing protein [Gammaproteobacteria bacterium]|nr:transglutaminase domain-containing protein [Gammaproteobacteria bacterium]